MALTATQTSIVQLVTAMFNAAPGKNILADLEALVNAGRALDDLANDLAGTSVFQSMYPSTMTDHAFAVAFINNLVGSTLTDANKAIAVAYTQSQLDAGLSRAQTMQAVSEALLAIDNTDADFGTASLTLENKLQAAANYSETQSATTIEALQAVISTVTADPATIPAVINIIVDPATIPTVVGETVTGKSSTLTTAADTLGPNTAYTLSRTTANNDTIVATELTLNAADVLDGGAGIDTLSYTSSGVVAINEAGFHISNIETLQITAAAIGGTNFDLTSVAGLVTLKNVSSSEDLTLTGGSSIFELAVNNVSSPGTGVGGSDLTPDTTVLFNAATVVGSADTMNVSLNGNLNVNGSAVGDVTVNGIETFNVTTTGAASQLAALASNTLTGMTIKGDQDLTLGGAIFTGTVNTLDATAFTAKLDVTLSNSDAVNVKVLGGSNDDRADFRQGFNTNDAFIGGEGTDTLILTNALATSFTVGTTTAVEVLEIIDTAMTNTININNFTSVSRIIYNEGITNGNTAAIINAETGITVEVDSQGLNSAAANGALVVDLKTDGTADEITIELNNIDAAGETMTTITVDDVEILHISADDTSTTGLGNLRLDRLDLDGLGIISNAATLTLSGDADFSITHFDNGFTPAVTVIDASGMTGVLGINATIGSVGNGAGLSTAAAGAVYTFGSGGTDWTMGAIVGTQTGGDTIHMGAGADTVRYNHANQSAGISSDTIMGFKQGSDVLNLVLLGLNTTSLFVGNVADTAAAGTALTGTVGQAVFITSENALVVDANGDGNIDNTDIRVTLAGITALTAADLGLGTSVTFSANKNVFNTANAADSKENNALADKSDTINTTQAQVAGSTIDGLLGTDTLNISATAAANEIADLTGNFTNIETVNLDGSVEGVNIAAADLTAAQVSKLNGVSGTLQSLTLKNSSNIVTTAITDIEILNLTGVVTMTVAQHNAFSSINATAMSQVTLSDAGNITTDSDVLVYQLADGTNTVTLSGASQHIVGGIGVDTVNAGDLWLLGYIVLQGATDVLNVTNGSVLKNAFLVVETLEMSGIVNMTNLQHNAFTTINASTSADHISLVGAHGVHVIGDADVESYTLSTGNTNVYNFTVGALAQNVLESGTYGTVILNTAGAYTGTYTSVELLSLTANTDISATTDIDSFLQQVNIANDTSHTMTVAQYNAIENLADNDSSKVTAMGGTETITITTSGAADAMHDGGTGAGIEHFILSGSGADTFTISETADAHLTDTVRGGLNVSLFGGGADVVAISNLAVTLATDASVSITNFLAGDDQLDLSIGATGQNAGYQTVTVAASAVTVGANSVIEIHTGVASAIDLTAVANDGAIESIILNALEGDGLLAAGDDLTVILYSGTNAGIYQINYTNDTDQLFNTAADIDLIELVGIVESVGADALSSANFI